MGRMAARACYKAWFPLSQLRPRQRPISSQNKAISVKDDCSTVIIALFLCRGICCVMETRLKIHNFAE